MRKIVLVLCIAAFGLALQPQIAGAQATYFTAKLTAAQEGGDVQPDSATGTGAFVLTESGLSFWVTVEGLSGPIANAHFHSAELGVNGGVVFGIADTFDGNTAIGEWTFDDGLGDFMEQLLTGQLYVNVHTGANPGGEIRGQVLLSSGMGFTASLDAAQEGGTVTPDTATGTASLTLTPAGLVYSLTVEGLSGPITASHFHNAPAGTNGGVVYDIGATFDGHTASGVWLTSDGLDATMISELMAGNLYLNVHTSANPGGEIRGQVLPTDATAFTANLTPAQEPGDITPDTGSGTGSFWMTSDGLGFSITVDSLSGPISASHFHSSPIGVNGGVVHDIGADFDGNTASGLWLFADGLAEQMDDLLQGNLYINVHTSANPGGEIRGQVLLSSGTGLTAALTAGQENTTVTPDTATGTGSFTLVDEGLVFAVTAEGLSGPITASHFHNAPAGMDGGVVHDIGADYDGTTARGVWTVGEGVESFISEILDGNIYVNIHTGANPGGEIRGQLGQTGVLTSVELNPDGGLPEAFSLAQNFPNPFNPTTEIRFDIREAGPVALRVYNLRGQLVATLIDQPLQPGAYRATFEPAGLSSGVYVYQLKSGTNIESRRMVFVK